MTRPRAGWAEAHADANLIGAWLEGRLPAAQTETLQRHLALCASCREWASLAALAVAIPPARRAPGTAPAAGWAMAAAAALVIAAGGFWLHGSGAPAAAPVASLAPVSPQPTRVAMNLAPAPPPATDAVPTSAAARPAATMPATLMATLVAEPSAPTAAPAATPTMVETTAVATANGDRAGAEAGFTPIATGFVAQPRLAVAAMEMADFSEGGGSLSGPRTASPHPIPNAAAHMAMPLMSDSSAPPSANALMREAARHTKALNNARALAGLGFASDDAVAAGAGATTSALPLINAAAQVGPQVAAGVDWALNKSGELLHAVGGGNDCPDAAVAPHALATRGDEVWTGGFGAQLCHSLDGGKHWERVSLPGVNADSTATIVSIAFRDDRHGTIDSDDGRQWTTSDGGLHWKRP